MKHYATLLNLDFANDSTVKEEELIAPHLQRGILQRMLWGYGETKEKSMLNAIENMEFQGVIETYECQNGAHIIVKNSDGKDALLNLWIHEDEYHDEAILLPLPGHDTLTEFCERYKLPEQAKQELAGFFTVFLHKDNQQPVLQENSMTKDTPNSLGLFDSPIRSTEKERVTLTQADIERQREAGAFAMGREEAIAAGFINPHDEPDTVIVDIRREEA